MGTKHTFRKIIAGHACNVSGKPVGFLRSQNPCVLAIKPKPRVDSSFNKLAAQRVIKGVSLKVKHLIKKAQQVERAPQKTPVLLWEDDPRCNRNRPMPTETNSVTVPSLSC